MDLLVALEQAWAGVVATLESMPPEGWERATPCEGWAVRDVAAHLGHLEGMSHDFPQPDVPDDFDPEQYEGLDLVTNTGVAARRSWHPDRVLDEIRRASAATLDQLRSYDADDWRQLLPSPVGLLPASQTVDLRLADVWIHLLDIRAGLGREPSTESEPEAAAAVIHRAVRLTGWGAVKRAHLPDGTRIRLELTGPGGTVGDLVVEGGRGAIEQAEGGNAEAISGSGLAYLLTVGGRSGQADAAGGLDVRGESARTLLERYRIFV